MTSTEALAVIEEFVEAYGHAYDCGVKNGDSSPCHVCTTRKKEKQEVLEAIEALRNLTQGKAP